MRRKRRTHKLEFKAKIVLAVVKGDMTMAELVKKFDVHANQVTEWKKQQLTSAPEVFGSTTNTKEESEEKVQALRAKIGQLTMENGFQNAGSNGFAGPEERNCRQGWIVICKKTVCFVRPAAINVLAFPGTCCIF